MKSREIERLYASMPKIKCKGLCAGACTIILFSKTEARRMERLNIPVPACTEQGICTALKNRRCTIYPNRPFICRLYGVSRRLRCDFGCIPERFSTDKEEEAWRLALGEIEQMNWEELKALEEKIDGTIVYMPEES